MGRTSIDIRVYGAGIVGAACAYYLAQAGAEVEVIDSGCPGGGATGAGMGHLVVVEDSPDRLALSSRSLALWRELLSRIECEALPCGTLWLAENAVELAHCRTMASRLAAAGVEAELLDERSLREAEPALHHGLAGALLVPGDWSIYAPKAAARLLETPGIRLRRGDAREWREDPNGPTTLFTVGDQTPLMFPDLPIRPRRGHLAITDRCPGLVFHQLVELGYLSRAHSSDEASVSFNVQPRASGQILIGSTRDYAGFDSAIARETLAQVCRLAAGWVPALAAQPIVRAWTGFRPDTPDHRPYIGRHSSGAWVAAGHEGLGITLAPITGHLIADLVLGREPIVDPSPYRLDRETTRG